MKQLFFFLLVSGFSIGSFSQSPFLSVKATVTSPKNLNYKIEMKICKLKKPSAYKDIFGHDTSAVNFAKLAETDFECGNYFGSNEETEKYNRFQWANQHYAYENVIVLKFSDESSRAWHKPMYIVMPMHYQSFVTLIELTDIVIKDGKILYLSNFTGTRDKNGHLYIKQSLLNTSADDNGYDLKLKLN